MNAFFKDLKKLYAALLIGQLLICLVFIVSHFSGEDTPRFTDYTYLLIAGILLIGSLMGIRLITKKQNTEIPGLENREDKQEHYRKISIIRWALIEGANLFSLVFMFTTGQLEFIILFLIGLSVFIVLKPDKEKYVKKYGIV